MQKNSRFFDDQTEVWCSKEYKSGMLKNCRMKDGSGPEPKRRTGEAHPFCLPIHIHNSDGAQKDCSAQPDLQGHAQNNLFF